MGHHGRGEKPCPLCEKLMDGKSVLKHVMKDHGERLRLGFEVDEIMRRLEVLELNFVYVFWPL